MLPRLALFMFCPLLCLGFGQFTALHEFKTLDYVFSSAAERDQCLNNGTYNPAKNIPTSIRVWNGVVFMAIPRISSVGVPFTLAIVGDDHLLKPYPNAYMNWLGNAAGFRSVYAMEIDMLDRLWVLDSGRYGEGDAVVNGPASLVIVDLKSGKVLHVFIFPDTVVSFSGSLLQDIALDTIRSMAFISDRGGQGALIVYDFNSNSARRFVAPSMEAESSSIITINDIAYPSISWAMTGIALSSDATTLFFSPVNRGALFMVSVSKLRSHFSTPVVGKPEALTYVINITDIVSEVTVKPSQSSRLMGTNQQHVYFGLLSHNAIGRYSSIVTDPLVEIVASDNITMQWIDSMCFSHDMVYVLSNRMHRFVNGSMDWSDINFRVLSATVSNHEESYLTSQKPLPVPSPIEEASNSLLEDVIVASASGVMGLALGALLTSCFMRSHIDHQRLLEPGNGTGWSVSDPHRLPPEPRDSTSIMRASKDNAMVGPSGNINSVREKSGWLFSE